MIPLVDMGFLRDFPFVLKKEQRIQFLAIAYVGDVIGNSYTELFNVIAMLSNDQDQSHIDERHRSQVFRLAWEIVEHADSLDRLMCASSDFFVCAPAFDELKTYLNTASRLRNQKVHLFQNLRNLGEKKRLNYLHGILKWTHDVIDDRESFTFSIKVLTVEPMTHSINFRLRDGIESIHYAIDNVILEAFNSRVNISRFMLCLQKYVATLADFLEETAERLVKSKGIRRLSDLSEAERTPLYFTVKATRNE